MNFMEAVKELKTGKKVRKISWTNTEAHIKKVAGNHYRFFATIYNAENNQGIPSHDSYSFREYEILATDWEIYEYEKLHTFEEALKAYKEGKKIRRKNNVMIYQNCYLDLEDVMANDWLIIDKEETK